MGKEILGPVFSFGSSQSSGRSTRNLLNSSSKSSTRLKTRIKGVEEAEEGDGALVVAAPATHAIEASAPKHVAFSTWAICEDSSVGSGETPGGEPCAAGEAAGDGPETTFDEPPPPEGVGMSAVGVAATW